MSLFFRSDGRHFGSSDEETDDAEPLDHDYNLPQVKGKKVVNRGKWTKDEVKNIDVHELSFIDNYKYKCILTFNKTHLEFEYFLLKLGFFLLLI